MDDLVTRLEVPGTHNFREVAPGVLTPGRLYRSDALHRVTRDGRRRLKELGIGQVIDLRSAFDRRIAGRDRLRGTGAAYLSVPIDGTPQDRRRFDPSTLTLFDVYRAVLTRHQEHLGLVVRTIASAEGAVVVHCTAGKDRTGLVSALILATLGIERDVIVADYAATAANLSGEWTERMLRKVRRFRVPITENLLEILSGSPPAMLNETLDWLDSEHGGVLAYLEAAGVDAAVRDRLRASLLPSS
ncbi:tyrosine-protein phosphatase [Microbacterium abyssi]|uniref:tyrosine-protein phosphatase n=1 Tax=Microbacterium abyssi TaxID=2782166 RepID=UPI001886C0F6|nr:tyrosine-protein phosphatase [Microbacterium sp. A18JL241]